jgi:DNA polymerase III subunit delta
VDFVKLIEQLKKKTFSPLYFLHGPEPFYIDEICTEFENSVLTETEKAFNFSVFYGKDADARSIMDTAQRFPVMSDKQVVILKEAQDFKDLALLQSYITNPNPMAILVIAYKHKKYNFNSKFGKLLQSQSVVFESKGLYDNQLPDWIIQYAKTLHIKLQIPIAQLLAEYLGNDLSKISNELKKIKIHLPENGEILASHVEDFIGISNDYNVFELQKAIAFKNSKKIAAILHYFESNPKKNPPVVVISNLCNLFSRLYHFHFISKEGDRDVMAKLSLKHPAALTEIKSAAKNFNLIKTISTINLLKDYDLHSKGVGYQATGKGETELIKELVWKIIRI